MCGWHHHLDVPSWGWVVGNIIEWGVHSGTVQHHVSLRPPPPASNAPHTLPSPRPPPPSSQMAEAKGGDVHAAYAEMGSHGGQTRKSDE